MMRRLRRVFPIVVACVALAAGVHAQQTSATASLGGRVVHGEAPDLKPLARAIVAIDAGDGERLTVTDNDGRFLFEGLTPGRYLLNASKVGWVPSYYGSARPGRPPGVRIAVTSGTRTNVEVPIVRGGVLAGRILDPLGQPMARQSPWILEQRMVGDQLMLARTRFPYTVGTFERGTNDLGEFRLFGLPPGTYYLAVSPFIAAGARVMTDKDEPGLVAGYARVYYPGTTDPDGARAIVVGPGEAREGLDFSVPFVNVSRVEGVVLTPEGAPAAGSRVSLDVRAPRVSLEGATRTVAANATGEFVFTNVPPDAYRISTRPAAATPAAADLWGHADISVAGVDVSGVIITLAPAGAVAGRLEFDSTSRTPPADVTTIRLHFLGVTAMAQALVGAGSLSTQHQATVNADGSFQVIGLPPDRYLASATWPGMRVGDAGFWLTTVTDDGRDLGDAPIDIGPNERKSEVTLAFSDRIGSIEGSLTDATGRPAPGYVVLAFPVDRASWNTTSRRMVPPVQPATDGRFRVTGLLPGEYYLAVVTEVAPDEATDARFLETLLPLAMRVRIEGAETRTQHLRIGGG